MRVLWSSGSVIGPAELMTLFFSALVWIDFHDPNTCYSLTTKPELEAPVGY